MTSPLFHLTGSDDFPKWAKILLSGPPKSGKTSFLGTVPNIVIADTEPHANNLQSIAHKNLPYVTVEGSYDLQRLLFVLKDDTLRAQAAQQLGLPAIEAVAIDTMDTLQMLLKKERMREQKSSKFVRDDWQWLKDEMAEIIASFTKLPMHVIFTVHIKTQTIGPEDEQSTIFLPALQGSIDEEIAGLVGYSLLTYRKEDVRPDGSPYTRYLLRAEGNETYNYLGNRAAGRLPDVIEPTFQSVLTAIEAGRAAITNVQQPGALAGPAAAPAQPAQPPVQQPAQPPAPPAPPAQQQAVPTQEVAQSPGQGGQPEQGVQTPVQTQPAPAQQQATPAGQPAQGKPDDDAAPTPESIAYAKRVYDACGFAFPEALLKSKTLGDIRQLVKMWQAIQGDHVAGKLTKTPPQEMAEYLQGVGLFAEQAPAPTSPEPKIDGTIEQVMAYVGDDLAKAQEAYDLEMQRPKPRGTLTSQLEAKGVKVQTPVQAPAAAPFATPVEQPAPSAPVAETPPAPPATPVTPEAPSADTQQSTGQQEAAAVALAQTELGAVPINEDGTPKGCEVCGGPIDDEDIATLAMSRYGKRLDVQHYIEETKKSH